MLRSRLLGIECAGKRKDALGESGEDEELEDVEEVGIFREGGRRFSMVADMVLVMSLEALVECLKKGGR